MGVNFEDEQEIYAFAVKEEKVFLERAEKARVFLPRTPPAAKTSAKRFGSTMSTRRRCGPLPIAR